MGATHPCSGGVLMAEGVDRPQAGAEAARYNGRVGCKA